MSKLSLINRQLFYSRLKTTKLTKLIPLKQSQVDGIEVVFNQWDMKQDFTDIRWLSYMLATMYHECDGRMQPIEEYGKGKNRPYGKKLKHSGKSYTTPNKIYYGRGDVQLTWYENYELMGRLLCVDLLNKPELALDPIIACKIMFEGMSKGASSFGDFTGKCLEMYFNKTTNDPKGARKIINGTDKAKEIADIHYEFLKCFS